ncbi:thioredoxin family protein [Psychroserpens damuponensis]|uniref:thioredoxin family protein n=1 Tax=Psychroserpens damuponensis TaxID=943936 RepID=UPI00058CB147|nr:thioredoxin family protein [Psychroserpens damuponensis]
MKTNITIIIITLVCVLQPQAQTINYEITTNGDTPFLLGEINKSGLEGKNYMSWFRKNYEDYKLDQETITVLAKNLKDYQILAFMGTWCGDSRQEVPKFYKILEACEFPEEQLTVIALSGKSNMYKQSPNHREAGLNIHRVPTFIFMKNGKEMNRIVEHPVESFEKDMLNIVTNNDYKSNYQIVTKVNNILKNEGLNGLKKQQEQLTTSFKDKVESMYELNTYGRILYSINQHEEAITVFDLNTKLFPNQPITYMSLANTLGVYGERTEAIAVLEKAIQLFPNNKDLLKNLDVVKTN